MLDEEMNKERERPKEGADPAIGRFLQADSVVMPESLYGMNRYMYVEGSPVRYTDPDGYEKWEDWARLAVNYHLAKNHNVIIVKDDAIKNIEKGAKWAKSSVLLETNEEKNGSKFERKLFGKSLFTRSDLGIPFDTKRHIRGDLFQKTTWGRFYIRNTACVQTMENVIGLIEGGIALYSSYKEPTTSSLINDTSNNPIIRGIKMLDEAVKALSTVSFAYSIYKTYLLSKECHLRSF